MVRAWDEEHRTPPDWQALEVREHAGQGLEGHLQRPGSKALPMRVRLGSAVHCEVEALPIDSPQLHLSDAHGWVASFVLAEELRADAVAAVAALKAQGIAVQLLSGDRSAAAQEVAARVGIAHVQGDCTPEDKLRTLQRLQAEGRRVAMVGDGLNDGPVLAAAHASFALGNAVPLAQARADFIVMGSALSAVPEAIAQARRTLKIVRQNLAWAAGYNALCVPLALAGWLPAWLAGIGMAASSLWVVLNAARLARASGAAA